MKTLLSCGALLAILMVGASTSSYAGAKSKIRGTVPELLAAGFKFAAGSQLSPSPDQNSKIMASGTNQAWTRSGTVYLVKDKDLLVCIFMVVQENNAADNEFMQPSSTCYEIK